MKLVYRFQVGLKDILHIDKFDRIRGACLYKLFCLKQRYRVATPSSAKRIEKKMRKIEIVLNRFYVKLKSKKLQG